MKLKRGGKLRLEKWYSTENRHEVHYFLAEKLTAGYQESAYVVGFNPEIISAKTIKQILAIINDSLSGD